MKINYGSIEGNTYRKYVNWNKAVLWMDREISIHQTIGENIIRLGIKDVEFIDNTKKKKWSASLDKVKESWKLKKVGQEPQFYVPIEIFKEEPL